MKKLNLVALATSALLLAACSPEPQSVVAVPTPILMSNTPVKNDACCFNPAEMVQYKNIQVPDCSKQVEVVRYKNSCVDCAYPTVVRTNSLCKQ